MNNQDRERIFNEIDEYDPLLKKWDEFFASPEAEADFAAFRKVQELSTLRLVRVGKYLESLSQDQFDVLVKRLIDDHTDELKDSWYKKNIFPIPTTLMSLLFDYVFHQAETAKHYAIEDEKLYEEYATGFADEIAEYRGYVFQMYFGQGVSYGITKNKEKIFWGW